MPSWIPGEDYLANFKKGDPYTKVDEGYACLRGAGYAAIHPELEGVDPEDYPDITKLSILGDILPFPGKLLRYSASPARIKTLRRRLDPDSLRFPIPHSVSAYSGSPCGIPHPDRLA